MITSLQAIDIVFKLLYSSDLKAGITGDVYKNQTPENSLKEDVVVNCITINNADLQAGVINVNIHVPNLSLVFSKIEDNSQPDYARLNALGAIAVEILQQVHGPGYNFDIQNQTLLKEEAVQRHYLNIRLNFRSINVKKLN